MKISARLPDPDDQGTSLLEMLVVISLLSVLLVSVGYLTRSGGDRQSLDRTASATLSLLSSAKAAALERGRTVRVEIDTVASQIRSAELEKSISFQAPLALGIETAQEAALDAQNALLFFPDGSSTGGRLEFSDGDRSRVITVHWLTGLIQDAK